MGGPQDSLRELHVGRTKSNWLWEKRESQDKASQKKRIIGKKKRKDKLPRCGGEWWYPQHEHGVPLQKGYTPAPGCELEESQES